MKFAIPIKRPHNVTMFGAIGNKAPKPIFFLAKSTNQHDVINFLKVIRDSLTETDLAQSKRTYIVLDNHTAHKAIAVKAYIDDDERLSGHRFVLFFQPPYSSYYNS